MDTKQMDSLRELLATVPFPELINALYEVADNNAEWGTYEFRPLWKETANLLYDVTKLHGYNS